MKWLVSHLRVFFDKRSGKAERIEQFIVEHGIEYGLQFVTPFSFNPTNCLYTKKFCDFLQSYEKSSTKQRNLFLCFRDRGVSLSKSKNFATFVAKLHYFFFAKVKNCAFSLVVSDIIVTFAN